MIATYTNNTNEFQMVASQETVLFTGTLTECEKEFNKCDEDCNYNGKHYYAVEIVAPGETVSCEYEETQTTEVKKFNWSELLGGGMNA